MVPFESQNNSYLNKGIQPFMILVKILAYPRAFVGNGCRPEKIINETKPGFLGIDPPTLLNEGFLNRWRDGGRSQKGSTDA